VKTAGRAERGGRLPDGVALGVGEREGVAEREGVSVALGVVDPEGVTEGVTDGVGVMDAVAPALSDAAALPLRERVAADGACVALDERDARAEAVAEPVRVAREAVAEADASTLAEAPRVALPVDEALEEGEPEAEGDLEDEAESVSGAARERRRARGSASRRMVAARARARARRARGEVAAPGAQAARAAEQSAQRLPPNDFTRADTAVTSTARAPRPQRARRRYTHRC